MKKRVFLLELNEFNRDLLLQAAKELPVPSIQKLVNLEQRNTTTDDTYSSDFLEPWVQWVNIHTGEPSQSHLIKHLGDIPSLGSKQLWEALSSQGVTSGVWGALNSARKDSPQCLFFLPDPWTFSEKAHPSELNALLDFPRYMATHRSTMNLFTVLKSGFQFSWALLKKGGIREVFSVLPLFLKAFFSSPKEAYPGFCLFEYLSTAQFLNFKEKYDPQLSILFLNSIAHLQHYHWRNADGKINKKLRYAFLMLDRALEKIFASLGEQDVFLCTNALSQENSIQLEDWVAYRPNDLKNFLETLDIKYKNFEQLMSYDGFVFFDSQADRDRAAETLESAEVNGQKLLLVERTPEEPTKLFFRANYALPPKGDELIQVGTKKLALAEHFHPLGLRTGRHIPVGTLFSKGIEIPETIYNHQLNEVILNIFNEQSPLLKPQQSSAARVEI